MLALVLPLHLPLRQASPLSSLPRLWPQAREPSPISWHEAASPVV
jgi:hypothetical protein